MFHLFFRLVSFSILFSMVGCASSDPTNQIIQPSVNPADLVSTEVLLTEEKIALLMSGGTAVGVGADVMDPRRLTAWFYGKAAIKTCYNALESFGLSQSQIERAVRSSIARWKKYFLEKKIDVNKDTSVNVNLDFVGVCQGEEDLVLHFGTGPIFGNLKDLKAVQTLSRPVAYANKTHMSRNLGWSKGYIRFVPSGYYESSKSLVFPDWGQKNSLELVVTHELGHVFGFEHVDNTVMDSKIIREVFASRRADEKLSIDGSSELVFCQNCEEEFEMAKTVTASKDFFINGGLKPQNLRLFREGEKIRISDGEKTKNLHFSGLQNLEKKSVHLSNFGWNKNGLDQVSFVRFGHVEWSGKKHPIVLAYKGTSSDDEPNSELNYQSNNPIRIELLFLDNGEFKLAARFVRKSHKE